ncbi:hypothetical protein [Dinghuibacter silviterrae]|uniref:HNH endonuclease n=1 Tax=Dinghuibacter silviterrae TaxID=1539049 RepID=A0A4R8DW71_9BACT|nr:hypothetical protein [Dinghuibacter silviterrae]TDX02188.1 hypothetical protein EDB95_3239 [Dinghuibacter silviterrae]
MARLAPTQQTIKKLFALSGNNCSFPSCSEKIVDSNNHLIGEICHIEAAEPGGQRYNPTSTDDYRRSLENLILLCGNHHKITNDVNKFPVSELKRLKVAHEARNQYNNYKVSNEIVQQSISQYMKQENANSSSGSQINNQANTQNIDTQIGTQHNHFYGPDKGKKSKIEGVRKINKDFKDAIDQTKQPASPPGKWVIDFKSELSERIERTVEIVPTILLKFRKDNGRIKADVESHEIVNNITLDECDVEAQELLRSFLLKSDPEKTEVLKKQLMHKSQQQPAIVTCDGFLINGNRRKLCLEQLYKETNQDPRFENMRVVILPESVSELDIRKIENRYQLQDEGKSEYHGLNRALTIRSNELEGYSLEAQLRDDPKYTDKHGKDLEKIVNEFKKNYLHPLECVDRYLRTFGIEGHYNVISESAGDKEGRWQAFIDYSNVYYGTILNKAKLAEFKVKESEIGKIENAIFKVIRKRSLNSKELESSIGKVHDFVRKSPKYIKNAEARKFLLKISEEVPEDLPGEMKSTKDGKNFEDRDIDEQWGNLYKKGILGNLIQAHRIITNQEERDKPLELLEDALKKLRHENLKIENMDTSYYDKAMELTSQISAEADKIHEAIDHRRYNLKKLNKKK